MKKTILGIIIGISLTTLIAAGIDNYQVRKNTAEVEKYENIFVFTDSKPIYEYDYLGTVKISLTLSSGQYDAIRDKLIKKAKKEYPQAEGIIIKFKDGGTDRADVIKFK